MISAKNYEAFRVTAIRGDIKIVKLLLHLMPNEQKRINIINAQQDGALLGSAKNGHFIIIKELLPFYKTLKSFKDVLNKIFPVSAENGHLFIIRKMVALTEEVFLKEEMIHANDYCAFRDAAANGHIEVLKLLLDFIPDTEKKEQMIHANNDAAFRYAATNGKIKVLELLVKLIPDQVKKQEMVCANDDEILKNNKTSTSIIQFVLSLVPDKWNTIKENNFLYCYSSKILKNNIEFIQKLNKVYIEFPKIATSIIFSMKKCAQKIYNLVLSSKTIMMLFAEPVTNGILYALYDRKSDLLEYDRRFVAKAMITISNDNEPNPEVRFLDKILREKFPEKIDNLLLSK